jgi:hypothetical protein
MSAKNENLQFFPATYHKLTVSDLLALTDFQKGLILSCNGIGVIGIEGSLDWIDIDYELES